ATPPAYGVLHTPAAPQGPILGRVSGRVSGRALGGILVRNAEGAGLVADVDTRQGLGRRPADRRPVVDGTRTTVARAGDRVFHDFADEPPGVGAHGAKSDEFAAVRP